MPLIEDLRNCRLFSTLTDQEYQSIMETVHYKKRTFEKNEILFSPLDSTDHIAIIIKGSVEIHQLEVSGHDIILDSMGPYQLIAGPSVYSSHPQYANTVMATKKSQVILIDKEEWRRLISLEPKLLDAFLQFLSDKVLFMSFRLNLLSQPTLKKKIVAYLLKQQQEKNRPFIHLPYSKKKLSDYLNAQPQSLSRTLKQLVEEGYIEMDKNTIRLLDIDGLKNLLI